MIADLFYSPFYIQMSSQVNRGKRKLLQRALQSIPCAEPPQKAKAHTEAAEITQEQLLLLARPNGKEDKGMKAMRRLHRYRQGEQQETILNKYKSLQLAKRQLRRKSEQKLNRSIERQHASLQKSPYLPLHLRKLPANNSGQTLLQVSSKEGRKWSFPKKITQSSEQLKQAAKNAMKRRDFRSALKCLQRAESGTSDLQLLDMSGICLMNLREFQQAVVRFSRVLMLDPDYSKKAYISVALCENQLNHAQRCLHYINQCIARFPDFYEAFYFKGKLLYKQQLYQQAVDILLQAASLNPHKKEIKLLIAQCYYVGQQHEQALLYYQRYLGEPTSKNAKHAVRYGSLLISIGRETEGVSVLEQSLIAMEAAEGAESERVEANSQLSLAYFRIEKYELCAMRVQEVISRGSPTLALQAIKCLLACKIIEHDYYGGIYFLRRLPPAHLSSSELKPYLQFLEGVALLMKRRSEQALGKLMQLPELLQKVDEFSVHIHRNYRLFILYGHFLQGEYSRCLKEAANQREVLVPNYWQDTLAYIQSICKSMIDYNSHQFDQAQAQLQNCLQKLPMRTEAALFLALLHMQLGAGEGAEGKLRRNKVSLLLTSCADRFGSSSSNYSAFIFYYRGLLSAWEGEWAAAAAQLQLAIQKSQDNFFNFYYLRGIALANLQNYKQAISDASLALSILEEPPAYLLRAKCLQIDGNPGQAFADLQAFIALRPEDKQVHKFAGHLLFENGAFEDALQAYGQGDISCDDLQVFMTRSKTYFLVGNFLKAAEDMQQAAKLTGNSAELIFDQKVMQWLASLLQRYIKNQCEDEYEFDLTLLAGQLQQFKAIYKEGAQCTPKYGKIFKLPQYLTLAALCQFYLKDYSAAMDSLIEAIQLKQAALQRGDHENQGQFEQQQAQKLVFINQMYYNLAICCCMAHDYPNAQRYLRKCAISPQLHNYDIYLQLIDQITGRQPVQQDTQYLDLFSLRNKLSRYLPKNHVPFVSNNSDNIAHRPLKLCIPYPKVQPPQITPALDRQLLLQIDLNQLERRADAPWIYRQKNSIKFTQRIDVFSRFQLQKSQVGQKRAHIGSNFSQSSFEGLPQSLRQQLKLDSRLEQKLNKLIRRQK